jgi:hypothetical protein
MISTLLIALIYIGILCIIGYALLAILAWAGVQLPPPVVIILKAIIGIVCLLVLAQAITGQVGLDWPGLHRVR